MICDLSYMVFLLILLLNMTCNQIKAHGLLMIKGRHKWKSSYNRYCFKFTCSCTNDSIRFIGSTYLYTYYIVLIIPLDTFELKNLYTYQIVQTNILLFGREPFSWHLLADNSGHQGSYPVKYIDKCNNNTRIGCLQKSPVVNDYIREMHMHRLMAGH